MIANIIIWPFAYLATSKFLDNFAYRMEIDFMIFLTTLIVSIIVTVATVSFHAVKSAVANPVESLRYE